MPDVTHVIAHRGAGHHGDRGPHSAGPGGGTSIRENTVAAFRRAVEVGVAGIELDARRTADGAVVVHHDAVLGDGRAVVDCLAVDLPHWVPTLPHALDACAGAFVNIEIKNVPGEPDFDEDEAVARGVMEILAGRSEASANWLISSFRMASVDRCRAVDADVETAWLTATPVGRADAETVVAHGHAAIHPWEHTLDGDVIALCQELGLRVNTWTCNEPNRARALVAWGIDGICTDVPDEILAALSR